ncbi:hypothetical protein GYMLUDRAFT_953899 [Collybiopsis luxurians FD-317 M1]|nr:hypothetical protein GYMLUDRAFT_953899 [Collybiopsis luxurians FD-317 M1]
MTSLNLNLNAGSRHRNPGGSAHRLGASFVTAANAVMQMFKLHILQRVVSDNASLVITKCCLVLVIILSSFTVVWWGSFSDRRGRVVVLRLNVCCFVITDLLLVVAHWVPQFVLPAVIISALLEGIFGALPHGDCPVHVHHVDRELMCTQILQFAHLLSLLGPFASRNSSRRAHAFMGVI